MKTDELIETLGVTVERVEGRWFRNAFIIALIVGAAVAVCLMEALLGISANPLRESHLGLMILTTALLVSVVAAGSSYLLRAAHPGMSMRRPTALIVLLAVAFIGVGVAGLLVVHPAAGIGMIFGPRWTVCLTCSPLFAIGPFLALVWVLRKGAPTQLRSTGAVAGLVAGTVGAGACALHQPGGSLPFAAIWYAGPILLCALLGALLGPRVLRW